jgi:chromosome segregation ATPase
MEKLQQAKIGYEEEKVARQKFEQELSNVLEEYKELTMKNMVLESQAEELRNSNKLMEEQKLQAEQELSQQRQLAMIQQQDASYSVPEKKPTGDAGSQTEPSLSPEPVADLLCLN